MIEPREVDQVSSIVGVDQLDDWLSVPTSGVVEALGRLDGDLLILGVAGKMGPTLAWMARRALDLAGHRDRKVIGVARFSRPELAGWLQDRGIETIACDLLASGALDQLPDAAGIVSMFAMKFGTTGQEDQTWAMNAFLPGLVAQRYRRSRIVAFSTGNVYPLTPVDSGGPNEDHPLNPVGEYAMSCLGRERILTYQSRALEIPTAIIRLNYAVELRYGILIDLALKVARDEPIDLSMGYVNVIWQGDANAMSLQAFDLAGVPAVPLNVTGPDCLSVRELSEKLGALLGKPPRFLGLERPDALLNNASQALDRFGPLRVSALQMLPIVADWVSRGGNTLNKPTHFQTRDGRF